MQSAGTSHVLQLYQLRLACLAHDFCISGWLIVLAQGMSLLYRLFCKLERTKMVASR